MPRIPGQPVLVATLGTNPQVVTLAVDMLAEDEHVEVSEVYVIHTKPTGYVGSAVGQLKAVFDHDVYRGRPCVLHLVEITTARKEAVPDIRSPEDARAAFQAIFGTVRELKQARQAVHLSIAGGRNSMVVYGAAAAHILFDSNDRLWHIISDQAFERSGALHRSHPADAQLSLVPVISWSAWLSHAIAMWTEDPFQAFEMQQTLAEQQDDRQREDFLEQLADSEWQVLVAYAHTTHGGSNQQIADILHLSKRTVEGCFGEIYSKMLNFFDLPDSKEKMPPHAKRAVLMNWYADFFGRHPELRSPP